MDVGHDSPPPCEDPVTRPMGWKHLTVAALGPASPGGQAPRQEVSSQHRGREQRPRRGMGCVPPQAAWLLPAKHLDSLEEGCQGTELNQATRLHQVFLVVLKIAVYSALFIVFLDLLSFIISLLRDINRSVREDLIHHWLCPKCLFHYELLGQL